VCTVPEAIMLIELDLDPFNTRCHKGSNHDV